MTAPPVTLDALGSSQCPGYLYLRTTYRPGTGCRGPGPRAEGRTQTAGTQGNAPDAKVKGGIYAGRYSYYTIIEELS